MTWRQLAIGVAILTGCTVERAPGVSGDSWMMPFEGAHEGPCTDGDTRSCSIELGRNAGIVSCFSGTKVCRDGTWSACGATDGGSVTTRPAPTEDEHLEPETVNVASESTLKPLSLSEPGARKGICATNPCDPTCIGYDEKPLTAYTTTPFTSTWIENPSETGGSPPGFVDKLIREPCNGPVECGYDHHCDLPTKKCVQNKPGWTYTKTQCPSANITVGAACLVASRTVLPVCNRGTVPVPEGRQIRLTIRNGNWIQQPTCPSLTTADVNCSYTLPKPLYPGACVTVDACGYSGNAVAYVNADRSISECAGNGTTIGCVDNWSDVKITDCISMTVTNYLQKVYTETYIASCPVGHRPAWQYLAYSGTIGTNANGSSAIKFEAQTATLKADGTPDTWGALKPVANTATGDPAVCKAGVAGCPKNLFTALGSTSAAERALKLTITLDPTFDLLMPATLQSWQVSYSCVATE